MFSVLSGLFFLLFINRFLNKLLLAARLTAIQY
jgi:hypothetical protein